MKILTFIFYLTLLLSGADENFSPSVTFQNQKAIVTIKMADGIHLNREGLKFSLNVDNQIAQFGNYILPKGEIDQFGSEVYSHIFQVEIPIDIKERVDNLIFTLTYQGCSDSGVCFRPETVQFSLIGKDENQINSISETDSIIQNLESGNFLITLLTFFGFGLLLALTPCIFPLIPILSSIIVSQGEGLSAKRGFLLSLVYVISMSFAYSIAGIIASTFGANIQIAMQNPFVVISFSLIFVALAFSLFGFYEIKLPEFIQNRLVSQSDEAGKKGGFIGIAIMGFLSALIVGPCVAPPLAGAIIYISQTGDILLGGTSLFVMSLGMGLPLLLIGLGAGKFMPKPGGWMNRVSQIFGVVMIGIAIQNLSKILPDNVTLLLWSLLLITSSIYIGALEPLKNRFTSESLIKSFAFIMLLYGSYLFINVISDKSIDNQKVDKVTGLEFVKLNSLDELDEKLFQSEKVVMVDFSAKWCASCQELEEITFTNQKVKESLKDFDLYQIDVTDNSNEKKAMMKELGIVGPPAILFFQYGVELEEKRIYGFKNPEDFIKHIQTVK